MASTDSALTNKALPRKPVPSRWERDAPGGMEVSMSRSPAPRNGVRREPNALIEFFEEFMNSRLPHGSYIPDPDDNSRPRQSARLREEHRNLSTCLRHGAVRIIEVGAPPLQAAAAVAGSATLALVVVVVVVVGQ